MIKRLFDLMMSFLGLLFLLPFFSIILILIKIDSRGPVFFRQVRVGVNGKHFRIHKFRTMRVDAESEGRLTIGVDSRVTRVGSFLRKYKIDELPQLIDVLFGKMSLVGPRPEVPEFIEKYPFHIKSKVLSVKPGITDKASVEMIDENIILKKYTDPHKAYIEKILPLKQKYYLEYVDNNSFIGDICIILSTVKKIILR